MRMFRPPRSRFGERLEERGIKQSEVVEKSGVAHQTISNLASGKTHRPTRLNDRKIRKALREIDPELEREDLWD